MKKLFKTETEQIREEFMKACFFEEDRDLGITGKQAKKVADWWLQKLAEQMDEHMGVSQWRAYGKKMGYEAYWEGRYQAELIGEVEKLKNRFHCGACDGAKCGHTQGCQALDTVLSILKK